MHYMKIKWRREHPQPTLCTTTKTKRGKKPGIRRTYFRTEPLPVTVTFEQNCTTTLVLKKRGEKAGHAQNTLPDRDSSGHVTWSLPVKKAPLGRLLCDFRLRMRITYLRTGQVNGVTSGHMTYVTSGHVTSGSASQNLRKCGLSCTHILLAWWFYSLLILL
jgi:hypothetical protein